MPGQYGITVVNDGSIDERTAPSAWNAASSAMEQSIEISVVVPAFNAVGTLHECLTALLSQTVPLSR